MHAHQAPPAAAQQAVRLQALAAAVQGVIWWAVETFPETIGTRDAAAATYPINLINVTPARTVPEQDAEPGATVKVKGRGLTSPWPQRGCPACGTALDGGPVLFRCARCVRAIYAADLDTEYQPTGPRGGTA
jgi:hypothetical protein